MTLLDHEVTWSNVTNKKPNFFLCTMPVITKLGRIDTYNEGNELIHNVTWPCDQVVTWGHATIKTKYLFYRKANNYQTWQSGNLWWGKLTHDISWSSDHVIMWRNWKLNIYPFSISMTTKHGSLEIYGERNSPMESHNPLIMWWYAVTWKTKSITYPLIHEKLLF